ncbi:TetR/AcrR family transcriptional regulator [Mycolicibacterium sarraceniae]|uniref:HTH tetR-type domain-containing protein n=1 Tax=Mycolicibacterium sarraceniae TaxID=1534348 RepID=A0A7I7SZ56_9MYCO|nr:TetR/AcrR family transcriptional regulator [Mycolicibacterium sarraceniae]BBY61591.1 hypothetical protein MSAR_47270 [Mycolicibacterium sarraceniae]
MSGRHTRRSDILAVAAELFARKGVASTTVRDIGDAANIFSGSLYHFFASKDLIVAEILATFMEDVHHTFSAAVEEATDAKGAVRGLIGATLDVIDRHPHATTIYQNDRAYLRERGLLEPVDEASRGIREFWMTALNQGVADGSFRDDVPAEIFYRSARDTLWSTTHWPIRPRYSTPALADTIWTMFFDGFAKATVVLENGVSSTATTSPAGERVPPGGTEPARRTTSGV